MAKIANKHGKLLWISH